MTTISSEHPTAQAKLEDLGYTYEDLAETLAQWANPPRVAFDTVAMSVDELWHAKGEAERHTREWSEHKGHIVQELERRVKDAHPAFMPEDGGSREIVGETLRIAMTYSKTEKVNVEAVTELAVLAHEEGGPLNSDEYDDLVKWEPKVNGTKANVLKRRGGVLEEVLSRVKTLTSARPEFEAKAR